MLGLVDLRTPIAACALLAVAPTAARAQVSEQDRLQRCANNQARIVQLAAEYKANPDLLSDEEIARRRLEMVSARNWSTWFNDITLKCLRDPTQPGNCPDLDANAVEQLKEKRAQAQALDIGLCERGTNNKLVDWDEPVD